MARCWYHQPSGTTANLTGAEMTHWIEADSVSVGAIDTIPGVEFWDDEARRHPRRLSRSIDWFIYPDNSGVPGSVLASGNVVPTRGLAGLGIARRKRA
jgi:hypothetical protein